MKFLAILKDSFREALDSKVFYAMIGLSLLLILLVGSVSFKPLSADEALPKHRKRPRLQSGSIGIAAAALEGRSQICRLRG